MATHGIRTDGRTLLSIAGLDVHTVSNSANQIEARREVSGHVMSTLVRLTDGADVRAVSLFIRPSVLAPRTAVRRSLLFRVQNSRREEEGGGTDERESKMEEEEEGRREGERERGAKKSRGSWVIIMTGAAAAGRAHLTRPDNGRTDRRTARSRLADSAIRKKREIERATTK